MNSRRVESFLLRFVVTNDYSPADMWRGRIQHVSTGFEQKFDRLQDMLAFISAQLPTEQPDPAAPEMPSNVDWPLA